MHESSLAKQILTAVLAIARERGATHVRAVDGWIAETETLTHDALAFQFAAHAVGTPAADARLRLRIRHVSATCMACDDSFLPEHHVLLCPSCGSTEARLDGPTGIGIDTIEVD